MYADEGPYTIDVRHVEELVETTREAADGDRVRRDETAATAGDERDGGDRCGTVYRRRGVRI